MTASDQTQAVTAGFARVLGPFLVLVPGAIALRFNTWMKTLFQMFTGDPMWQWFFGALLVFVGLSIVANHRSWRGLAAIIISGFGCVALLRGVTILYFTRVYIGVGNVLEQGGAVSAATRLFFALLALAGVYLSYVGWIAKPSGARQTTETTAAA